MAITSARDGPMLPPIPAHATAKRALDFASAATFTASPESAVPAATLRPMAASLRLVAFDATDTPRAARERAKKRRASGEPSREGAAVLEPGLSPVWRAGTWLHRIARAADASLAATSWDEAIAWAAGVARDRGRPIASLQIWGHGSWGAMRLGASALDGAALLRGHALAPRIDELRAHLEGPEAIVWLRCCSAFGHDGRRFAEDAADRLGCRVAGHTFVIGVFQSGTHSLRPGEKARWDDREGIRFDRGRPAGALMSAPGAPNTVSCLALGLPDAF
jgi:Domain of unknown function (DUF4347)